MSACITLCAEIQEINTFGLFLPSVASCLLHPGWQPGAVPPAGAGEALGGPISLCRAAASSRGSPWVAVGDPTPSAVSGICQLCACAPCSQCRSAALCHPSRCRFRPGTSLTQSPHPAPAEPGGPDSIIHPLSAHTDIKDAIDNYLRNLYYHLQSSLCL